MKNRKKIIIIFLILVILIIVLIINWYRLFADNTVNNLDSTTINDEIVNGRIQYDFENDDSFKIVEENDFLGILNESSRQMLSDNFEAIYAKKLGEYFCVMKNNKIGVINKKGEVIIPFEYDSVFLGPFANMYYLSMVKTSESNFIMFKGNGKIDKLKWNGTSFTTINRYPIIDGCYINKSSIIDIYSEYEAFIFDLNGNKIYQGIISEPYFIDNPAFICDTKENKTIYFKNSKVVEVPNVTFIRNDEPFHFHYKWLDVLREDEVYPGIHLKSENLLSNEPSIADLYIFHDDGSYKLYPNIICVSHDCLAEGSDIVPAYTKDKMIYKDEKTNKYIYLNIKTDDFLEIDELYIVNKTNFDSRDELAYMSLYYLCKDTNGMYRMFSEKDLIDFDSDKIYYTEDEIKEMLNNKIIEYVKIHTN